MSTAYLVATVLVLVGLLLTVAGLRSWRGP
jgi:hypothetical protein